MKRIVFYTLPLIFVLFACKPKQELVDFVNPFIGATTTGNEAGKTFPGATTPWGMVQVSPNTITGGDNGPGYSYDHKTIEGFAFTQMSGIGWYGDLGNFLVMPTNNRVEGFYTLAGLSDGSVKGWRSVYDKSTETAKAGYYSVNLQDYGIQVEATAAQHSGALRFTYPKSSESRIQIDLARRVGGCSDYQSIKVVDDHTIEGWMKCTPLCGGWGSGAGQADYTVFFSATFSKPFEQYGFWSANVSADEPRKMHNIFTKEFQERISDAEIITAKDELEGTHIGFFTNFPTSEGEQVVMKVGISFVDVDGARLNRQTEIEDKSFDRIYSDARKLWNNALEKVSVSGATLQQDTIFYTALYHSMIDPRLYSDVDGRYIGGDKKIHSPGIPFQKRTIFSGWDVFRSETPLLSLIYPGIANDLINSLVELADESGKGYFERWEIVNAYSGCMVGNPALSVIADAYAKGIADFDTDKALRYAENTSQLIGIDSSLMFVPDDISVTLECAYHDWCLSRFASMLGDSAKAEFYFNKSMSYKNIFDSEVGWFRPRHKDGTWGNWPEDGDRTKFGYGCVESNPYQQGWFVPHDVDGMVELMGGREKVLKDLENFFEMTPKTYSWNQYYNHSNEPVHFVPYLFNHLGAPWLTQKWVHSICTNAYFNAVNGICGNDDCGQMSAWYVLSASGIHPICPGDNLFEITSPLFDRVDFTLDSKYASGRTFSIISHDRSDENIYIQKAEINGKPLLEPRVSWDDISSGATIDIYLGPEPCPDAFTR